jgi:hypothetical protein
MLASLLFADGPDYTVNGGNQEAGGSVRAAPPHLEASIIRGLLTRGTASNVAVSQDPAGNLKPAKDKSTERTDGIVALIMAIGRAMVAQEPAPSYQVLILG